MPQRWLAALTLLVLVAACGDEAPAERGDPSADVVHPDADISPTDTDPDGEGGEDDADVAPPPEDLPPWVGARATCGDGVCDEDEADACPEDCASAAVLLFDPMSQDLQFYPHDWLTRPAPDTATGLRVHIDVERFPTLRRLSRPAQGVMADLGLLDGFGTIGGAYVRFSRPIDPDTFLHPAGETASESSRAIVFGFVDPTGVFRQIPVEVLVAPGDDTLVLRPMLPLPERAAGAFFITADGRSATGEPLMASPWMEALLRADVVPPPMDAFAARTRSALAAAEAAALLVADEVVGAFVFTTQSLRQEGDAIAQDIARRHVEPTAPPTCAAPSHPDFIECDLVLRVPNYRSADRRGLLVPPEQEPTWYDLQIRAYVPRSEGPDGSPRFAAPYPTLIFGHGLGGDRAQARRLAVRAAPLGMLTISLDAPEHGDHPWRSDRSNELTSVLNFLGLRGSRIDMTFMRDNWRQAAWDKLGLLVYLQSAPDITGDGQPDVDTANLAYLGVSLGAIMGPEFLAYAQGVRGSVLAIGGARVSDILQYSPDFAPIFRILAGSSLSDAELAILFPVLQAVLDRGDPANYAAHLARDRFFDDPPLQVFKAMAFEDEVVPDETNVLMARILGATQLPPVLRPVGHVPVVAALPFAGNLPGGGTNAYMQFDFILRNERWERTSHARLPDNVVGLEAWFHFLDTLFRDGVGEVIDVYERFGFER